jgi:hypothetical protein
MSSFLHHPIRALEHEAEHLRDVERLGESGGTPFIVLLAVASFVLPILALVMLLAFGAAWLFG